MRIEDGKLKILLWLIFFNLDWTDKLHSSSYLCTMIYPNDFEHKVGFDEIRTLLKGHCLSTLGKEKVDELSFSANVSEVTEWLDQVREFRRLRQESDDFPMQYFFDVREAIYRIRLEGTHLEEEEVWD